MEVSMGCIISCPLQCQVLLMHPLPSLMARPSILTQGLVVPQGSMALPKKFKNRRMLTKNTPRVLFGKQEGWVLELYTPPPQPDHADPDKKHKEKEREKAHKKEEKKREKAEKERAKAKEKEEKERMKIERKRGSTIAGDPLPVAGGSKYRDNGLKDDQHSRDRSTSEGDASHASSSREDDNHASKRDKKKGKGKEKSNGTHDLQHHGDRTEPIRGGHEDENGHHARDEESKDHPERVVIHSTDSEGEHHDFTIDMGEWFDVEGTEMANWEKLELAARAPQQMMAWKQFFAQGETDDGVRLPLCTESDSIRCACDVALVPVADFRTSTSSKRWPASCGSSKRTCGTGFTALPTATTSSGSSPAPRYAAVGSKTCALWLLIILSKLNAEPGPAHHADQPEARHPHGEGAA